MDNKFKILVTGSAGFIGFHLVSKLLNNNFDIVGLDSINNYYDVSLKYKRLENHGIHFSKIAINSKIQSDLYKNYSFVKADISDYDFIVNFMIDEKFDFVVNLAAQAGVRYSIENPREYIKSNIDGFLSILEGSKLSNIKHLIYASSSSVYGLNTSMPLKESESANHPMAMYAVTKKTNELMAHSYSHLFQLPTTGLRFFTVYGPWGRPDMALFLFADQISKKGKIKLFNGGNMIRDFTYVDDIIESIFRLINKTPFNSENWNSSSPDPSISSAPFRVFNVGNSNPVNLLDYIKEIENQYNWVVEKEMLPMQPGDVPHTHSDISSLYDFIGFKPSTSIHEGVKKFIDWYKFYISSTK